MSKFCSAGAHGHNTGNNSYYQKGHSVTETIQCHYPSQLSFLKISLDPAISQIESIESWFFLPYPEIMLTYSLKKRQLILLEDCDTAII